MPLAFAIALVAVCGGALATYLYDEDSSPAARLCAGACTGLAAFGFVIFIASIFFGLNWATLALATMLAASPAALMLKPERRKRMRVDAAALYSGPRAVAPLILYSCLLLLLWLAFDRAMFDRADGTYTGVTNNLGDLPFHLSVIARFAYGQNFPPENPIFAGAPFTYPFIADLIAACFHFAGASLRGALLLENLLLAAALAGLLHQFAFRITEDRTAALIAVLLVFLSGGLGWALLFQDARETEIGIIPLLGQLPHDYTILPGTSLRWGNALTALLIPQRSLLMGLALAVVIFIQLWESFRSPHNKSTTRRMIAAGILAGLLPMTHAHSFAIVVFIAAWLALLSGRRRAWLPFFAAAALAALPQLLWLAKGGAVRAENFLGWHWGWDKGQENILWFWLKNTGLFIPLIVAAILWRGSERLVSRRLLLFYLPFALCFIAANLVRLAPWAWDNIKVIFYWYVASATIVALLVARLWGRGGWHRKAAAALLVSLTLAGGLDLLRVITRASEHRVFDRQAIEFAAIVMDRTEPRAVILHAPVYNHPVFLTGRRSLMGYAGHLWTHGIAYEARESDIKHIYAGGADAEALMRQYKIDYAVVGPPERSMMERGSPSFDRYLMVGEAGEYRLYKIERE